MSPHCRIQRRAVSPSSESVNQSPSLKFSQVESSRTNLLVFLFFSFFSLFLFFSLGSVSRAPNPTIHSTHSLGTHTPKPPLASQPANHRGHIYRRPQPPPIAEVRPQPGICIRNRSDWFPRRHPVDCCCRSCGFYLPTSPSRRLRVLSSPTTAPRPNDAKLVKPNHRPLCVVGWRRSKGGRKRARSGIPTPTPSCSKINEQNSNARLYNDAHCSPFGYFVVVVVLVMAMAAVVTGTNKHKR